HQKWCAQWAQYQDTFIRFHAARVCVHTTRLPMPSQNPVPPLAASEDEIEGMPDDMEDDE
ncbi:hypothetical protein TorRG33x02_329440, partial [Trema orientale]